METTVKGEIIAILTNAQCTAFRHKLHADALDLLQAENPHLGKPQIKAIFQACEDFWEAKRTELKADMDVAAGQTLGNALAKKFGKFWLQEKWGRE